MEIERLKRFYLAD